MRQSKQRGASRENLFTDSRKAKLEIQHTAASTVLDTSETVFDPVAAANKAKELLQAQRESVDMLTKVREKIESLSSDKVMSALKDKGYFIVDGLFSDNAMVEKMEDEGKRLYADGDLEVDVGNLGSGEYTVAIKGGAQQYTKCPRMVEWVVSTTKHCPEILPELSLDSTACIANLRLFDRKAFQASLELLTGSDQIPETTKPFTTVVADINEDKRRLSLQYYMVPSTWDEGCGGGLTFENGGSVTAKRDRLVIWRSDKCSLRKEIWKGNDEVPIGSCIEVHLVGKMV